MGHEDTRTAVTMAEAVARVVGPVRTDYEAWVLSTKPPPPPTSGMHATLDQSLMESFASWADDEPEVEVQPWLEEEFRAYLRQASEARVREVEKARKQIRNWKKRQSNAPKVLSLCSQVRCPACEGVSAVGVATSYEDLMKSTEGLAEILTTRNKHQWTSPGLRMYFRGFPGNDKDGFIVTRPDGVRVNPAIVCEYFDDACVCVRGRGQ